MSNIVIFKPNQIPQYLTSVNGAEYMVDPTALEGNVVSNDPDVLFNPDISAVKNVPLKYWKKAGNTIVEMTKIEKDAIDLAEKQARIVAIENYQFEAGELARILVDEGIITKAKLIAKVKEKEGI